MTYTNLLCLSLSTKALSVSTSRFNLETEQWNILNPAHHTQPLYHPFHGSSHPVPYHKMPTPKNVFPRLPSLHSKTQLSPLYNPRYGASRNAEPTAILPCCRIAGDKCILSSVEVDEPVYECPLCGEALMMSKNGKWAKLAEPEKGMERGLAGEGVGHEREVRKYRRLRDEGF